jgi:hypothetical protein
MGLGAMEKERVVVEKCLPHELGTFGEVTDFICCVRKYGVPRLMQ